MVGRWRSLVIDAEKPAFVAALNELAALKPGVKITREGYAAWWNAMRDWSLEDFRIACAWLAKTSEFMPNPFHFEQLRKATRPTAGEAWALVREAARAGEQCPEHPATAYAVRALGGMRAIGMTNTDQMPFLERRFNEHYETISEAQEVREAIPSLAATSTRKLPYDPKRRLS
jgi:hypothetical protein